MKSKVLALGIVLGLTFQSQAASAMKRVNGKDFSCKALTALVNQEKVIYIRSFTFGGYVASSAKNCKHPAVGPSTTVDNSFLPAKDIFFCNPGLWCRPKDRWS